MTYPPSGDPPERFDDDPGAPASEPTGAPASEPSAVSATPPPASPLHNAPPTTEPSPAAAIPRTKTGIAFGSLIAGAIVLILLLVFILENTQSIKISFFGVSGDLPLGVALLLAAIGGGLLVGVVGTARIIQLRRHVRRRR